MSKIKKRNRRVGRKILFGFEILVLVLLVAVLFVYTQINKKMDNLEFQDIKGSDIQIDALNEGVAGSEVLSGYTNIALFGIDKRAEDGGEYGNSDTLIIASINNSSKEVRLVSLYRDAYLRIGEDEEKNGIYNKCNSAFLRGGPAQAISMLNKNLDLDIQNFVAVDFSAMAEVVDALGGLDVELSYEEIVHMNNHCVETSEQTGKSYEPVEKPDPVPEDQSKKLGTYHLNGVQVTSFCRIRQTASMDMGRTERQRYILGLLTEKAKSEGINALTKIMDNVFPMISTNFSKSELIKLGKDIFGYKFGDTEGFPRDYVMGEEAKAATNLDCLIPTTLETNVKHLHQFLFDDMDYQPSEDVLVISDFMAQKTGYGNESVPEASKSLITQRSDVSGASADGGYGDWSDEGSQSGYEDSYDVEDGYEDTYENNYEYDSGYSDDGYDIDEY